MTGTPLPHLPGIITADQVRETARHIAANQRPDGLIPWCTGLHADPWDHVEAAMALSVSGLRDEARRAYEWSARAQAADGTWPMEIVEDGVRDSSVDSNQCGYLAVGVWHEWLLTGDRRFVDAMWPTVRSAIEFVLELQQPGGAMSWSRNPFGVVDPEALLTGSACLVLSLDCALALAELLGDPQPDWELSAARLAHAVAVHPDSFADKSRYSMDWYYPVLGGAVRGSAARELLSSRWNEFVVAGRGVRCVADRPWVTAAETCELVLSLDALGDSKRAHQLLQDVQFLRSEDGGYWTGWVWPEDIHWPEEQTTWTDAAVILAADALSATSSAHALFRGAGRRDRLAVAGCDRSCGALTGGQS